MASAALLHFWNGTTTRQEQFWNKDELPLRVRSDKDLENVSIAHFMERERWEGDMISGTNTNNNRIQRFWRDVYERVLSYFYNLFYHTADKDLTWPIKSDSFTYIWMNWTKETARSGHKITVISSPINLWTSGQLQNPVGLLTDAKLHNCDIEGYVDFNNAEEGGRPILDSMISEECRYILQEEISHSFENFWIHEYQRCLNIVHDYAV